MTSHIARGSRGSIVYPEGTYYSARPSSAIYGDARGSAASVISNRSTGRQRRASASSASRPVIRPHSPPPVSRHLEAYNARVEPHSSSPTNRPRRGSVSYAPPSTSAAGLHGNPRASAPSVPSRSGRTSSEDESTRKGTTRFPRKFVNREAAEEAGWPFEEDRETGAIVVFRALLKRDIDDLIERTAIIRRRRAERDSLRDVRREIVARPSSRDSRSIDPRGSSDRHVAFNPVKTIITQEEVPVSTLPGAHPAGRRANMDERAIEKSLGELERKAAAANEARIRAEEVAKMVKADEKTGRRRFGRDVVVVR